MKHLLTCLLLVSTFPLCAVGQNTGHSTADSNRQTVKGCLRRSGGNYVVVEESGIEYALRGVGDKLTGQVGHQVEATGILHPYDQKTGTRSTKSGSNPSDTLRATPGSTLEISNVAQDVKT